jgi:uncharacterized Tic20 family protein
MNPSPTTEERIWAVFSHLSALAFGMGLMIPVLGWSEQRRKSNYASFQCLQALGYQTLGYTVWLLSYLLGMTLFLVLMIIAMNFTAENSPWARTVSVLWAGFVVFFSLGLFALYMLLPIIAAVACGMGRDFHYPIMGKRLARYLEDRTGAALLDHEHADRWAAAMGHFSVIIIFWGMLAPLTTWIVQGKRSVFLKFQSVQTTVYQAFVNLLYLGIFFLAWFGTIPLFLLAGPASQSSSSSFTFILGAALFLLLMLAVCVILLVVPLLHILGQWSGYRLLKGDNYHYPIIGKLVEKRLAKSYGVRELAPGASGEPLDSTEENA